jgi:Neurobeachin/BDCP, DUF4704 alpha solenoid region
MCVSCRSTGQRNNSFQFAKGKQVKVLLALDPKASTYTSYLDVSSENGDVRSATKLEGMQEISTQSFADAIACAGGVQLLLPLFSSLREPGEEGDNGAYGAPSDEYVCVSVCVCLFVCVCVCVCVCLFVCSVGCVCLFV